VAFVHGKSGRLLLDDLALSGYLKGWEHSTEREMADVTVEGDGGHKNLPGLDNGSLSLDGVFDNTYAADGQDEVLDTARGAATASVITAAPEGFAVGKRVIPISARESNYAVSSPVGDAVTFAASWQSEGQVDVGVALHDLTAETVTGNGASVDNAASSANGGVANLHVTAVSGTTPNMVVKVQHSTDDSVWADLITFTAATTKTAERLTVTGTVDRYTRGTRTITGTTPSFTFAVAFARR
jgi:hypothetical protein